MGFVLNSALLGLVLLVSPSSNASVKGKPLSETMAASRPSRIQPESPSLDLTSSRACTGISVLAQASRRLYHRDPESPSHQYVQGFRSGTHETSWPGIILWPGFITTDGDIWSYSRKLLKPSFDYSNIGDLRFLRKEVDRLVKDLPEDDSIVDLQPLLYVTFLNSALHFVLGVDPSEQSSSAPLTADEFVKSFHNALFYSMIRVKLFPKSKYHQACSKAHSFIDYYIGQAYEEDDASKSKSLMRVVSSQTEDATFIRSQVI
ncbi:Cytochrome P450- E-class- group I [Apiospora phragmitis]|uniref:Cytochrome P450- E-class- group I n=1 Tax=Apiospora phragmitis TaxID=2905665 RepID=A0ABR1W7A4_9PEZI